MKNDEYSFIKINDKDIPLVSFSQLCSLDGKRKYTDVLKCAKRYNTAKNNNHSKERLARSLFHKIVRVFIELSIKKIVSGVTYKFPCSRFFSMRIVLKNKADFSFLADNSKIDNEVHIVNYMYDKQRRLRTYCIVFGSNRLRKLIREEYKNGNTDYKQEKTVEFL